MENRRLPLPEKGGYDRAYGLSYQLACEKLTKSNIEVQCRRSGAEYRITDSGREIIIQYLNRPHLITLPIITISMMNSPELVALRDKLLILHYFNTAKGTPPTNRLITFRELPEGTVYFPTFLKRTIEPILRNFGKEPRLLLDSGETLGGHKADYGNIGVTIPAFSKVPITIILWQGDEELPSQGNVLFDANIPDYLPTEDITVLCETICWRLMRSLRE
jgi:hypothetical protein